MKYTVNGGGVMAAMKHYLVYVKLGNNEWMDEPARAENDREALRVVMNRRSWTKCHVTVTNKQTGDYARITLAQRNLRDGSYQVAGSPRIYNLSYKP